MTKELKNLKLLRVLCWILFSMAIFLVLVFLFAFFAVVFNAEFTLTEDMPPIDSWIALLCVTLFIFIITLFPLIYIYKRKIIYSDRYLSISFLFLKTLTLAYSDIKCSYTAPILNLSVVRLYGADGKKIIAIECSYKDAEEFVTLLREKGTPVQMTDPYSFNSVYGVNKQPRIKAMKIIVENDKVSVKINKRRFLLVTLFMYVPMFIIGVSLLILPARFEWEIAGSLGLLLCFTVVISTIICILIIFPFLYTVDANGINMRKFPSRKRIPWQSVTRIVPAGNTLVFYLDNRKTVTIFATPEAAEVISKLSPVGVDKQEKII